MKIIEKSELDNRAKEARLLIVRSMQTSGDICGAEKEGGELICTDVNCDRPCFQRRIVENGKIANG